MSDYRSAEVRVVDESGDTLVYKLPAGDAVRDCRLATEGLHEWRFTFRFPLPSGAPASGRLDPS